MPCISPPVALMCGGSSCMGDGDPVRYSGTYAYPLWRLPLGRSFDRHLFSEAGILGKLSVDDVLGHRKGWHRPPHAQEILLANEKTRLVHAFRPPSRPATHHPQRSVSSASRDPGEIMVRLAHLGGPVKAAARAVFGTLDSRGRAIVPSVPEVFRQTKR